MKKIGRFDITELSIKRIISGTKTRIKDLGPSFSWKFSSSAKVNKEMIQEYKGIHAGERCFIVANGPSLKKTDLELLSDEITIGMNRIYLNFDSSNFRPTYYISVNELVLSQFSNDISQLGMPKFINYYQRRLFGEPSPDLIYLKSKIVLKDFFQEDLTQPVVFGATVTFAALQLAFYMGFEKVLLIGLDHNYKEKGVPNETEKREYEQDDSHFHPQYFPKGVKWQLPDLMRSEIEFELARKAYEEAGREIIDATIGGKCNIFRKVDYLSQF